MKRREFITSLSAVALVPGLPALAQNEDVEAINAYLNQLQTAASFFIQINADGSESGGKFFLRKPGGLRFEYEYPTNDLVMAGRLWVVVFDKASRAEPQRFPTRNTPLSLLARNDIDVTGNKFVRRIMRFSDRYEITLFDPENMDVGTMILIINRDPMRLHGWIVEDPFGSQTKVTLNGLQENLELNRRTFDIDREVVAYERELGIR